jgi:hypothetical protein
MFCQVGAVFGSERECGRVPASGRSQTPESYHQKAMAATKPLQTLLKECPHRIANQERLATITTERHKVVMATRLIPLQARRHGKFHAPTPTHDQTLVMGGAPGHITSVNGQIGIIRLSQSLGRDKSRCLLKRKRTCDSHH